MYHMHRHLVRESRLCLLGQYRSQLTVMGGISDLLHTTFSRSILLRQLPESGLLPLSRLDASNT